MVKRNDRTNLDFTQPGYFNLTIYPVNLGGTARLITNVTFNSSHYNQPSPYGEPLMHIHSTSTPGMGLQLMSKLYP